jgi:hypothetical protein
MEKREMNPILQHITYVSLSTLFTIISLALLRFTSRARHRRIIFKAGFIYNTALIIIQTTFFLKGRFLFLDTFENSYIVYLGLAFAIFHARGIGALEVNAYANKETSLAFDNGFLRLLDIGLDRAIFFKKWTLIILATSAFYTVIISYLLIQIAPMETLDLPTRRTAGVILFLALATLGTHLIRKRYKIKHYNPSLEIKALSFGTKKTLQNRLHSFRANWILLVFSIWCATMTIVLLDELTNFEALEPPWRNLTKAVIYVFYLAIWTLGTILHHQAKKKSKMKNLN